MVTKKDYRESVDRTISRIEHFRDTVERAGANFRRGKGGQSVQYHDHFANITPSTLSQLEWWAKVFADAPANLRVLQGEIERLTAEVDILRGNYCEQECEVDGERTTRDRCGVCRKCAFRRGAEAMQAAAAKRLDAQGINGVTSAYFGNIIRATPIPEDKP
jgi:hypothetical protein